MAGREHWRGESQEGAEGGVEGGVGEGINVGSTCRGAAAMMLQTAAGLHEADLLNAAPCSACLPAHRHI